jgi:hypothetical protein
MGKILIKSIVAVLLLSVFLAIVPAMATKPAGLNDGIWIEPYPGGISFDTGTVSLNHEFSITVWAISSINCGAWSIRLAYNKNQLAFINCSYTGPGAAKSMFFKDISTVPVGASVAVLNATHNRVDFGESWAGVGPMRAAGSDSCAIIYFNVTAVPDKGLTLESMFFLSPFDPVHSVTPKTYLIDETSAKYGIGVDLPYKFEWKTPPSPYLISSPTRFYNRYSHWIGTTFDEAITLHVDAAWYLTNASFVMSFNKNFLNILTVAIGSDWEGSSYTIDNVNGLLDVFVNTTDNEAGDVLVATVTFNITAQGTYPTIYTSPLTFSSVVFWDHTLSITPGTHTTATITVEGFLAVHMPYLAVVPKEQVHGLGEFAIGKLITVNVDIKQLHFAWKLIGMEFRLSYDDTVLEVVSVSEGSYLGGYAPYGTWFMSYIEPDTWGPHVLVGTLILPAMNGTWNPPFPGAELGQPGENGTIATFTFRILKQEIENITTSLELFKIHAIDCEGGTVPIETAVNGTVTIVGLGQTGRWIDVYGGASNAGYGPFPEAWPVGYGGQGQNQPMEIVIPQSEVVLFVNLTYNLWPVQQKDVGFEVEGPYEHVGEEYILKGIQFVVLKETARTDENGQAKITFAMPWPCTDPESLLGVYKVTVTANLRDVIVTDTLYFYYDYMVHITKVTIDSGKVEYAHDEEVEITIDYGSHAMLTYPGLFAAVIKDELNVPFFGKQNVTVGGAIFCTWANGTVVITINVKKWMFSGWADLYVNCYDKDPTEGGFAWCEQYYDDDAIYILPE